MLPLSQNHRVLNQARYHFIPLHHLPLQIRKQRPTKIKQFTQGELVKMLRCKKMRLTLAEWGRERIYLKDVGHNRAPLNLESHSKLRGWSIQMHRPLMLQWGLPGDSQCHQANGRPRTHSWAQPPGHTWNKCWAFSELHKELCSSLRPLSKIQNGNSSDMQRIQLPAAKINCKSCYSPPVRKGDKASTDSLKFLLLLSRSDLVFYLWKNFTNI